MTPRELFVVVDGEQRGPYTLGQLKTMWASGSVNAATPYWFEGMREWGALRDMSSSLEPDEQAQATPITYNKKGKVTVLGWIGVAWGLLLSGLGIVTLIVGFENEDPSAAGAFAGMLATGVFFILGCFFWARR